MHLADAGGVIAVFAEQFGPGANAAGGVVGADELTVVEHAGPDTIEAGEDIVAGGHADWRGRIGVAIERAFAGEAVDVRGVDKVCAITREKVGAQLVGH